MTYYFSELSWYVPPNELLVERNGGGSFKLLWWRNRETAEGNFFSLVCLGFERSIINQDKKLSTQEENNNDNNDNNNNK